MKTIFTMLNLLFSDGEMNKDKVEDIYKVHIKGIILVGTLMNKRIHDEIKEELNEISLKLMYIKKAYEELGTEITVCGDVIKLDIYSNKKFTVRDKDYVTKFASLLSECFSGITKNMYFIQVDLNGVIENIKTHEKFRIYNEKNIILMRLLQTKENSLFDFLKEKSKL